MTATQIMELENVLAAIETAQRAAAPAQPPQGNPPPVFVRDPERYFFSIFGTPSTRNTWGWRVEGHHMSLHFTVVNGTLVAGAPTFFGTNPAEVRSGPKKGTRVLSLVEDEARALIETSPDRLIWGSDFPHLSFEDKVGSIELFNLLGKWAPDEKTRKQILVDNPARLYGF